MTTESMPLAAASYDSRIAEPRTAPRSLLRQAMIDTFARTTAKLGIAWIAIMVTGAVFAPFIANSFPLLVKVNGNWSSPMLRALTCADVTLLAVFFTAVVLGLTRKLSFASSLACLVWVTGVMIPLTLWKQVADGWYPLQGTYYARLGPWILGALGVIDLALLTLIATLSKAPRRAKWWVAGAYVLVALLLFVFPVNPPINPVHSEYREKEAAGLVQSIVRAVVPYSPNDYQRDVPNARILPPSRQHWMGTEDSGADVFSRMLHASRIALSIGFISTGIGVTIGVIVGGIMGFFGGWVDIIGMRLIEIMESVPRLILLLTICAFFGRNLYIMMAIIGLLGWSGDARFIRAEFFRLRNQDFVQAAVAAGLPLRSIIFKHMLPNGLTPVLVNSSFGVAAAILTESILSFLGLGLVEEPSWGQLLNQARAGGTGFQWWLATFPGLAIFLTVLAYNLIGEALRDALDPKLRKRD